MSRAAKAWTAFNRGTDWGIVVAMAVWGLLIASIIGGAVGFGVDVALAKRDQVEAKVTTLWVEPAHWDYDDDGPDEYVSNRYHITFQYDRWQHDYFTSSQDFNGWKPGDTKTFTHFKGRWVEGVEW